jgi:hypothetical protein
MLFCTKAWANSSRGQPKPFRAHNSAVECHLHTVEVVGSNPAVPTNNPFQMNNLHPGTETATLRTVRTTVRKRCLPSAFQSVCRLPLAYRSRRRGCTDRALCGC